MGDDASEGSNGAINVRMSEYDCLIKVGVSMGMAINVRMSEVMIVSKQGSLMGIEIRFLCSDFREQNGQLIDAL